MLFSLSGCLSPFLFKSSYLPLSHSLSLPPPLHLFISLPLCISLIFSLTNPSLPLSLSLSLSPSLSFFLSLTLSFILSLSLSLSPSLSFFLSLTLSFSLSNLVYCFKSGSEMNEIKQSYDTVSVYI